MAKLAPSILSCDFSQFQEELLSAYRGGAEIIHIDIWMDISSLILLLGCLS